jgi:hypothetical protein
MTCLADILCAETVFRPPFFGPVFATQFEIVRIVAGGAKNLTVLRVEWQFDACFILKLAHILENHVRRSLKVYPTVRRLFGKSHALWMRGCIVASETRIIKIMLHVERHDDFTRRGTRRQTFVAQQTGWTWW